MEMMVTDGEVSEDLAFTDSASTCERAKFNLYRYLTALEMNNFTTLRKFCGPQ